MKKKKRRKEGKEGGGLYARLKNCLLKKKYKPF